MLNRNLNPDNNFTKCLFLIADRGHESGSSDMPKRRSRNMHQAVTRIQTNATIVDEILNELRKTKSNKSLEILDIVKENNELLRNIEKQLKPENFEDK